MFPTHDEHAVMPTGLISKREVGLGVARALVDAARVEADRLGLTISAAVVDSGGQLVAAIRMDGAELCAMALALDKAYTAVACGMPTSAWAERTQPGKPDWGLNTALGGRLIAFGGGLPLYAASDLIGALGISGAAASEDHAVAVAAVAALGLSDSRR